MQSFAERMKRIEHKGIIQSINGENLQVGLVVQSACAGCHAKSACGVADMAEKIVDVKCTSKEFEIGETVNLFYQEHLGLKAMVLAYIIPFVAVLITLIVALQITNNEGIAGLLALGILVPYYIFLYLRKDSLKKEFSFSIEKIKLNN